MAQGPYAIAFLDAPYKMEMTRPTLAGLASQGWLADGALCVVEVAADEIVSVGPCFTQLDERTYGSAKVVFLQYSA